MMEFEAAIGHAQKGFLVFNISPEKITVKRVRVGVQCGPSRRWRKCVEELLTREVTTFEEKGRIYAFMDKMGTYLKDAEKRYLNKPPGLGSTCWCFILWAIKEVYYASGEDAYPSWWEDACDSIHMLAGHVFAY
ncbi:MAG: hypothetical protein AB1426_01945 [Bacillota bacterium]